MQSAAPVLWLKRPGDTGRKPVCFPAASPERRGTQSPFCRAATVSRTTTFLPCLSSGMSVCSFFFAPSQPSNTYQIKLLFQNFTFNVICGFSLPCALCSPSQGGEQASFVPPPGLSRLSSSPLPVCDLAPRESYLSGSKDLSPSMARHP